MTKQLRSTDVQQPSGEGHIGTSMIGRPELNIVTNLVWAESSIKVIANGHMIHTGKVRSLSPSANNGIPELSPSKLSRTGGFATQGCPTWKRSYCINLSLLSTLLYFCNLISELKSISYISSYTINLLCNFTAKHYIDFK